MITGKVLPDAMDRLVEDTYISLGAQGYSIDKNVVEAIDTGLAVKASDRIQSMEELIDYIYNKNKGAGKKTAKQEKTEKSNISGAKESSEEKKKKPLFLIIGGIVVCILIAFIVIKVLGSGKDNSKTADNGNVDVASATEMPTEKPQPEDEQEENVDEQPVDNVVDKSDVNTDVAPTQNPENMAESTNELSTAVPEPTPEPAPVLVTVPSVVKKSLSDAKKKLKSAGLKYETKAKEYSNSIAKGKVISQSIEKGTMVAAETVIKLTISKGKKPATPSPKPSTTTSNNTSRSSSSSSSRKTTSSKSSSSSKKNNNSSKSKDNGGLVVIDNDRDLVEVD